MAAKKITVIGEEQPLSFRADLFDVDENGYLTLRADDAVVARFSPAAWLGVYGQEAVA
jgi:hypothetical protein